jgi:putative inorganic carbon (hco3(-)) transporter
LTEQLKLKWIYGICGIFILLNAALIHFDIFYGLLLPVIAAVALMAIYAQDKLFFLIVFFTPLSIIIEQKDFNLGLSLPTEPLMFGLMALFLLNTVYKKNYDQKIINHPVSLAIIFSLCWTFITCVTSELPLVSFKYLVSKLWFVIPFYFLAILIFKNYQNINRFYWMYILPFAGVIIYTVIQHSFHNFEHKPAHWVMDPFFNDHTSYGAMLVMFYPVFFLFFREKKYSNTVKLFVAFLFVVFSAGIVLSYTRAAWLSLACAICLAVIYFFRIRFSTLVMAGLVCIGLFFAFRADVVRKLEKNRQDSSGDFAEHVQSMSNVTSDASNLERINRWQSAFRMFNERPFFGWGPGTYSFVYAPFQHSKEKTIISTNAGNMGNAHSEYIGPLAEQGVLGTLSFLLIIGLIYYRGTILYFSIKDPDKKWVVLITILGFTTYVIHGFLNNFLDTDKAAVPFWGFAAILTAIDLYHSKEEKEVGGRFPS